MSATYTITTRDLAARLQTTPDSIRKYRAGMSSAVLLKGLPEPVQAQPHCLWLIADIEAWLYSRRTFRPEPKQPVTLDETGTHKPKRGRPRLGGGKG